MISAEAVRERVKSLPSLPSSVVALGEAIQDDRCTVDRILAILAKDPPLSAAMLRLANSVGYGGARQVTDLRSAIQRLGYDALLNLGRSASIIRDLEGESRLDLVQLWQHSVAVGLTAKGMCRLLRKTYLEESAFLSGLLHDIGKIALDRCFSDEYQPVIDAIRQGKGGFIEVEPEILGISHAEVGAVVAANWNFPESLVEVIRSHHSPAKGDFLSNLICLCDLLVRSRIPNCPADENMCFSLEGLPAFQDVFGEYLKKQDLDMERITFSIDDELDHAISFVKLAFQD